MEVTAGKRDGEKAGTAQAADQGYIRRFRRDVRVPAHYLAAGPPGRRGRPGAGPQARARAGPGRLPAAAVAAVHHAAGRGRADPRPGEPRLRREKTRRENGRRYYV